MRPKKISLEKKEFEYEFGKFLILPEWKEGAIWTPESWSSAIKLLSRKKSLNIILRTGDNELSTLPAKEVELCKIIYGGKKLGIQNPNFLDLRGRGVGLSILLNGSLYSKEFEEQGEKVGEVIPSREPLCEIGFYSAKKNQRGFSIPLISEGRLDIYFGKDTRAYLL